MTTTLRILALLCGVGFWAVGWVWAYFIAVAGFALGGVGLGLLAWAARRERAAGLAAESGGRGLHLTARWSIWSAAGMSLVALVATLAMN